ncbi:hypothetical protein GCM10008986_09870 [Salinibacillus aidingensis]|uniref:Glycosyl transferase family 1 domain-containing protein n=1 Tax=Salinibacillus aidingensis TaxID=237684 RepID=A0ABP3KW56_9BACI
MTNRTIWIADNVYSGHHKLYMDTLNELDNVNNISHELRFSSNRKNIKRYIKERRDFLKKSLNKINNGDVLHLLYLDNLYTIGPFSFGNKKVKIVGTLHHYPQTRKKMFLLKLFSKNLEYIIVHSKFIKQKLLENKIKNVIVIDYPVFNDFEVESKQVIRKEYNIDLNKLVVSILGGTRKEKGLDLLLEAFKYLDDSLKKTIKLNIVGKEEFFSKEYIQKKIRQYNIDCRLELDFIANKDFVRNIVVSDLLVLPYKSDFTGNSGPMTEAVYRDIPIIGPDEGNLGFLINSFNLGYTFKSEDPADLSFRIKKFSQENWQQSIETKRYKKNLEPSLFLEKHKQLYNKIL